MWGSIPERRDHTLSQRQMLNNCATQAPLSFVFLTLPAARSSCACSRTPCFSMLRVHCGALVFSLVVRALLSSRFQSSSSVHSGAPVFSLDRRVLPSSWFSPVPASAPELRFSVWLLVFLGSRSQSALLQVQVRESGPLPSTSGYCFPAPERGGSLPLPFIFLYLCADSRLPISYLNTQRWRCSYVEIQVYLPASQSDSVGFQDGLVDIQLDLGPAEKRSPTPPPSFLLLAESGRFSVHRASAALFFVLQLCS